MNLVFNELSLNGNGGDFRTAINEFEDFLKMYIRLVNPSVGFSRDLFTCVDLNSIEIHPSFYVSQWRNNKNYDRDLQILFKRICDRQIIESGSDEIEISYKGKAGTGFVIAYLNGLPTLSIKSHEIWDHNALSCNLYSLADDEESETEIKNFSDSSHIKENEEYIKSIKMAEIDIDVIKADVSKIQEFFPNLLFHENAKNQLLNQVEIQHFPTIIKKLKLLDDYFSTWDGKYFDPSAFPTKAVSPESPETLKRFKDEHTFVFGDAIGAIIVSWHIRYTGNIPGRIYFEPYSKLNKGLICSLTTKLPTVSNPKLNIR